MDYYKEIYKNIGQQIKTIILNSFIPPELLFALCCNESGKWLAQNDPVPVRAEPHVLNALKLVKKGEKQNYKGLTQDDLVECSPDKLFELSCSYGVTQIMGWWTFKYIPFTILDIQNNSDKALQATIHILSMLQDKQPQGNESALQYINSMDYESVFKIWNTGRHDGKTYDEDYVKNGYKAMLMWLKHNP